jgi:hypothetical protein
MGAIDRKYHSLIRHAIETRLTQHPAEIARSRKPLEPPAPFGATWELRFGPNNRFRVFYEVDDAPGEVWILAIGVKVRNRLRIGTEEFER